MDIELQISLIAAKASGDTEVFAQLLLENGEVIEQEALSMLTTVGEGFMDTDTRTLDAANSLLQLIDRAAKPTVVAAVDAATRRLAEVILEVAAASPLSASRFNAAVQMAERFPELSAKVTEIREDAIESSQSQVALWRAHSPAVLSENLPVLLRLSTDRLRVETSRGQSVPASACERIWRLSYRARQLGRAMTPEEFAAAGGTAIGTFSLIQVEACGAMTVSCHRLEADELDGIATQLRFTPS